ncbi:copper resistance CopC family protein [Dactylosporangium sp. CA-092794]|uniref:copper resistance CopC family protein n=1 Tax=Dactylosporangium sp. CA-092794 TaxID=3239929 RepID=UPI003D8DF5BA
MRRLVVGAFAVLLAAGGAVGIPAGPAWAHATLLRSDPAKGSTVTTPVATITLTFDEMVRQSKTVITVTGPDGTNYSDGAAQVVDKNVLQAVKPLPAGAITVAWKSAAADGDAISGSFGFTSAVPAPTSAAPSPEPTSAAPVTAAPTSAAAAGPVAGTPLADRPASGEQSPAGWWILAAVVVVAVLAGGGWVWSRRRRARG